MDRLRFFAPVRIRSGEDVIDDIESVHQAVEFLHKWPAARRGPVYDCALNCCSAALAGNMSVEDARRSMASFVKITGLSIPDAAQPMVFVDVDVHHRHVR